MKNYTRAELLALPVRDRQDDSQRYDSLLIFNSRQKHDSGWLCMVIVGCRRLEAVEICARYCDDIEWLLPPPRNYGDFKVGQMRMDCLYPAGALHAWVHGEGRFKVGVAISSITIELLPAPPR